MKLTSEETKQILDQRKKKQAHKDLVTNSRAALAALSDEQAVQIASQLASEYKRIHKNPGPCTCDSQWTNPECPRVLAGWSGFNCDIRPDPIAYIEVSL